MKKTSRVLAGIGIALVFATAASADISWTFRDVNFALASWSPNGTVYTPVASLSGSFSTDNAVTTVTDVSHLAITADQGYSQFAFSISGIADSYLPGTLGIYGPGWSSYIDLYLTHPLTSAGGAYSFSSGVDCPGSGHCGELVLNTDTGVGNTPQFVIEGSLQRTPEPGFYALLATGLVGLVFVVRRKRAITR